MIVDKKLPQPPVQPMPMMDPPPYSGSASTVFTGDTRARGYSPTVTGLRAASSSHSIPPVNQVSISTRYKDISGTFYIDPWLPGSAHPQGSTKSRKRAIPNASFRTRHGAISLDLATTSDNVEVAKAEVLVTSRSGDITINLLEMPIAKQISLEAHSRRGNVVVFVPKTFRGVIQLNTRKGSLDFLPALVNVMKILKETDRETLILVGDPKSPGPSDSPVADFCELSSIFGKITVGLRGEDKEIVREVGFWKKLGVYLQKDIVEKPHPITH